MQNEKFNLLREKYPVFGFKNFRLNKTGSDINIDYDFEIEGLTCFTPSLRIDTSGFEIINDYDSPIGRKIVFYLGLVEVVSYLKAVCCPKVIIDCGFIDEDDKLWFKKLWFNGLGEFFYKNGIDVGFDEFVSIECNGAKLDGNTEYNTSGIDIVPVGGGKDSAVTAEIVKRVNPKIKFFTVNSQKARTDTVIGAGYGEKDIIPVFRKISPELLELNKQGFWNGHTPFSAVVAFISLYCAYLIGGENIILSNEASANESNIEGLKINHQYSKSYEFEYDFTSFVSKNITDKIKYFSILRPFNELQIAKQFSVFKQYHKVFRSCNAGSKQNIWCAKCPKCLFVYSILSPFIDENDLNSYFSKNMLDDIDEINDFDGLTGLSPVKPFECVGTVGEVKYALALTLKKYGEEKPVLLKRFCDNFNADEILTADLLSEFNSQHNIPEKYLSTVKEMYGYVSKRKAD